MYEYICPGCNANYVGKTEKTLHERCAEHAWDDKDSIMFNHLNECMGVYICLKINFINSHFLLTMSLIMNLISDHPM